MDYSQREFQSKVEDALSCSGAGTELVTVWIPPGKNLDSMRSRLRGEAAEAENIKSKRTRDRVTGALEKVLNLLHKYREVPKNGLVLCGGYIDSQDEYVTFEFNELPEPIRDSKYECSDEFAVRKLMEMAFGGSEWWGLATVTRDSASIGRYSNTDTDYVDVIDTFESHVMGKSQAGGQSQARFARLRQEQRENHYKKAAKIIIDNFEGEDFQGLALGGPNVTINDFIEYLPTRLQDAIVTVERVDHAGSREALVTLAQSAESAFAEEERARERELVEQFKKRLSGDSAVAYGQQEVDTALDYGAVDTLLISADFATHFIEEMTERVEQQGGDVVVVSTQHEEGYQLDSVFNGLAALLRFEIN